MKKILFLVAITLLAFPALSYAATYQYVATDGTVREVEAPTADAALLQADDRMPTSGVLLVSPFGVGGIGGNSDGMITYQYVNTTGDVDSVEANDASEALLLSVNKAPHSGVYMAEVNPIPESIDVSL